MAAVTWTCLVRIQTKDEDRSHLIEKTSFNIGRTEDADLPLTEPSVSRSHLSVELRGPNVFVTDLKSGNGTLINGKRIEGGVAIALSPGDTVKLGLAPHEFHFQSIPKPFELLDVDNKQNAMSSSMQDLAVQAERRAKETVATERTKLLAEIEAMKSDLLSERTKMEASLTADRSALESSLANDRAKMELAFSTDRASLESSIASDRAAVEADRASIRMESDRLVQEARREAETLKTTALIELQSRKASPESEIASLKQQVAVAAAQERLKYAKDADQFMADAQKKIAKDYEDASLHIEQQTQSAQEKAFALIQDAEAKARLALQGAQDEASSVRQKATEEARILHQDAMKKHSLTLSQLQDKFQSDMASKREEVLTHAKQDAERERAKYLADGARETAALEEKLSSLKTEVGPLQEKKDRIVRELKELDEVTTQARRELERNSKEVDTVRTMMARMDELKKERTAAESALESIAKKLSSSQATLDKEMADMRQKALLAFENEKKGSTDELAKQRLKALEDVQKKIQAEEKRYAETLSLRAVELSQRISSKIIPALPDLMADSASAGARVKAAIEASTRESLLNETTNFHAPTVNELAPAAPTSKQKAKRNQRIGIALALIVIVLLSIYGKDIYRISKGSDANSYATQKMEENRLASVYHPEQDARYGNTFRETYWENVLFMRGYYEAKTDSLNQQKWLLHLNNDLEQLRKMGLTEDDMVAYTSKENAMLKQMGELRDKIDAQYVKPNTNPKALEDAETENVTQIKKILKTEANYQKIRALEKDFVSQLMR